ncbi:uncharacterized protein A4U43_C10F2870 [Asparagus officinalis]|uniref:CRAL-TRIO domain-containing protein n=1 Tax=Asparagus officinalis TaxID=4686 RepID=A0A5P1E4M5_ASPOF|nr:uncharacterized protein LOC109825509 [Asparagus officinalis]ONK55976.1 uncharacterized protein A4U43_C10F2870 [Asparagus officinalis]
MSSDKITSLPLSDQELLFEKLEAITIQGSDKRGRRIVRIIGKFFPARVLSAAGGEQALKGYLEKRIFPAIGGRPFTVVYVHTYVNRSDNFPGVSALRSDLRRRCRRLSADGIQAVFSSFHPGAPGSPFLLANFLEGFLFSAGLS